MTNGDDTTGIDSVCGESSHSALQVFIAYDDVAAGKLAVILLKDLARKFNDELGYTPLPWSFKLLMHADWQGAAEADALKSDMLIFATSGQSPVPSSVKVWWEKIIAQKRGTTAAVICLSPASPKASSQLDTCFAALGAAASAANLDFFVSAPVPLPSGLIARREQKISQPQSP